MLFHLPYFYASVQVLQWFDTVEGVKVSSKLLSKRWTTEITKRDQMFLDKLGVSLPY